MSRREHNTKEQDTMHLQYNTTITWFDYPKGTNQFTKNPVLLIKLLLIRLSLQMLTDMTNCWPVEGQPLNQEF